MKALKCCAVTGSLLLLLSTAGFAQYAMENLGRGMVAIHKSADSVFVSWRVLGTDPDNIAFNLYRKTGSGQPAKLNDSPITGATIFSDIKPDLTSDNRYFVKEVLNGKEGKASEPFVLKANAPVLPYLSLKLQTPEGYTPNDISVGDLDGDGEYEIILHQAKNGRDNSQAGVTGEPVLQAYKLDGTMLWSINLGKNIREGAHYTQFIVYDLDGDGKAEVACKTADGSVDGKGKVIGDASKDWRTKPDPAQPRSGGYILSGPEFLTVFNGMTGAAMSTVKFIPPRDPDHEVPTPAQLDTLWGDGYGNRMDRFLAAVAYLDGKHPSLVMSRGYYTRTYLAAWDFQNKKLTSRWVFDSGAKRASYSGQGNHNLSVTDVDGDGKDEIVFGAMTIDDDGKGLYTTRLGHGDALHVGDLDTDRPGLEVFDIQERFSDAGANFRDARTGEVLWRKASVKAGEDGEGPGRGLALNIDPRYNGSECWVTGAGITGMFDAKGNKISERTPSVNFGIYWDGDLLSELLNGTAIDKWDYANSQSKRMFDAKEFNCASNNGTKSTPGLSADILGDWREEVIYRTTDGSELRIFSTTIPTTHRFYTFMHNPQYRESIAWQNVAYNQPPHTNFYIGDDMKQPPRPNIVLIKK